MVGQGLPLVDGEWAPQRSGDYETDNRTGRELAEQLHKYMISTDNPAFYGTVIRAITKSGHFEGVEVGFCSWFGVLLIGL